MSEHKPGGSTPLQYGLPAGATELQDLIEHRGMNFAQGNIFKAQYRAGTCTHSDELRDARKTLWFAQREVDRLELEEADRITKLNDYTVASQALANLQAAEKVVHDQEVAALALDEIIEALDYSPAKSSVVDLDEGLENYQGIPYPAPPEEA